MALGDETLMEKWHRRAYSGRKSIFTASLVKLLVKYFVLHFKHIARGRSLLSPFFSLFTIIPTQRRIYIYIYMERHNEILIKLKQQAELKDEMCAF